MNSAQQLQAMLDPTTGAVAEVRAPFPLVFKKPWTSKNYDDRYLCIDVGLYINITDFNSNGGDYLSEIVREAQVKCTYNREEVEAFLNRLEDMAAITRAKMLETERKQGMTINPCMICGKEVIWGVNGCPVVEKGSEMGALFGANNGWKHYKCEFNPEKP